MIDVRCWFASPTSDPIPNPKIVVVGGEGIGPEVTRAACTCLRGVSEDIEIIELALESSDAADSPGRAPLLESADTVLFGAAGEQKLYRDLLLHLRFRLDTFANFRPVVSIGGKTSSRAGRPVDLVIVRELTEGLYPGREGELRHFADHWPEFRDSLARPIPKTGRFALRIVTEEGSRRIARKSILLALYRQSVLGRASHITVVTKSNVLSYTDGLFWETVASEARKESISVTQLYVDDAARRLVACPEEFDVLVTSNLFGDILSDVACEVAGGIGVSPSASLGDRFAYFEPIHGSAPQLVGKGIANPIGTILSAAMLLAHLGRLEAANRLAAATLDVLRVGPGTPDLGGEATTWEIVDAITKRLA